jgi:hypothetical protein
MLATTYDIARWKEKNPVAALSLPATVETETIAALTGCRRDAFEALSLAPPVIQFNAPAIFVAKLSLSANPS